MYILLMVDPDAPSSDRPVRRWWRHWLLTDVPVSLSCQYLSLSGICLSICTSARSTYANVGSTRSRNLCRVSCTRNLHVCRLIWYYKFFLIQVSCTQLSTALFRDRNCLARDTNRATWLVGELFWCKKL